MTVTTGMPASATAPTATLGPGSVAAMDLVTRLTELAKEPRLKARRPTLEALSRALSGTASIEPWQGLSLHDTLGYPILSGHLEKGLVRFLDPVRTVLVFLPIVVTWAGLFDAVRSYRSFVHSGSVPEGQSFFTMWLDGFGGRLWLGLETMAMLTVAFVLVAVGIGFWLETIHRRQQAETEDLQGRLTEILSAATLHLASTPAASPKEFRAELTRIVKGLKNLVNQVNDATVTASRTMSLTEKAAASVEAAAKELDQSSRNLVAQLQTALTGVSGAVQGMEAHIISALDGMEKRTETTARALVASTLNTTGELRNSISELNHAVQAYTNRADEGRDNVGRLIGDHEDFLNQLVKAVNDRPADGTTQALIDKLTTLETTIQRLAGEVTRPRNDSRMDYILKELKEINDQISRGIEGSGPILRTTAGFIPWFRRRVGN